VLEELLANYQGTLLLVSHDRAFLDNVVTSTLVLEGEGRITEHVGGYSDWRAEIARLAKTAPAAKPQTKPAATAAPAPVKTVRKPSSKEQRELAELPGRIASLEEAQAELSAQLGDPNLYKDGPAKAQLLQDRLAAIEKEHVAALARWMELEG
jgi:ATP-binding cassette subfamily F protein uup